MYSRIVGVIALAATMFINAFGAEVARIDRDVQLSRFMQAAAESLGSEQRQVLTSIENEDQRYLALTYYLRAGRDIATRWSWNQSQIDSYRQSAEFKETLVEIEKISARFAKENPKHRLFVNTKVRSLEEQVSRWQTVRSVATAARELRRMALLELEQAAYGAMPQEKSVLEFAKFLASWRPSQPPTLAAPGLSLHGKGRAYDFQIHDDQGRLVAGTDSAAVRPVWDGQGWTEKLMRVVKGASDRFAGPLEAPREPWHYRYIPRE